VGDPRKSNPWPYVDPTNPDMDQNTSTRSGRDILTPGYDNIGLQMNLALKKLFEGEQKPEPSLLNRGTTPKQPSYVNPEDMNDEQKRAYNQHVQTIEQMRRDGVFRGAVTVRMREDGSVNYEGSTEALKKIYEQTSGRNQSQQQSLLSRYQSGEQEQKELWARDTPGLDYQSPRTPEQQESLQRQQGADRDKAQAAIPKIASQIETLKQELANAPAGSTQKSNIQATLRSYIQQLEALVQEADG
jgi:hypothetical protein